MEAPQKTKIDLPYNPAILLLGMYKSMCKRYTCTPMFITALFTIVKL
jgi:hypothetical protein